MKKLSMAVLLTFLFLTGCNQLKFNNTPKEYEGSYPAALMWNGVIYSPVNTVPIDESSIDSELGKITKEVRPMPEKNGEINYLYVGNFALGDKIYSIKDVEITESIALLSKGKYYRLDRIRTSLGIVWDNKIYDFEGNFLNEKGVENLGEELGRIKRVGIDYTKAANGDITTSGFIGDKEDLSIFQVDGKIRLIKGTLFNEAIAVEGKDGKFHRAVYVKPIRK